MIRAAVAELITALPSPHGVYEAPYLVTREVPCRVRSVYSDEFYQGMAQGLSLSLVLVLNNYREYRDENRVKFEGAIYRVVRTYIREDKAIELVLEREASHAL